MNDGMKINRDIHIPVKFRSLFPIEGLREFHIWPIAHDLLNHTEDLFQDTVFYIIFILYYTYFNYIILTDINFILSDIVIFVRRTFIAYVQLSLVLRF